MVKTSPATLDNYAETLCPRIEAALDGYSDLGEGCPIKLREAIRYSLLAPGKRLRPMLTLLAAEACAAGRSRTPFLQRVRWKWSTPIRSSTTICRPWTTTICGAAGPPATRHSTKPLPFWPAMHCLLWPSRCWPNTSILSPLAAACCAALAEAAGACNLVGGQADDMAGTHLDEGLDLLESIDRRKTGALIHVSLRLGGITAKADAQQLSILDQYGRHVGLAFQIIDDLLDVNCSEQSLGKRVGKDARQGKLTFPGILGIDQSARYAGELINKACQALEPLGSRAAGLDALARYVLKRNR